ncbi:MAG TPA: phosphopantetheine-binding protein [Candidatus Babeliales bacterium]|nr:phosphopantetheine-binding protein [Candidatus Babeliales bacterium]
MSINKNNNTQLKVLEVFSVVLDTSSYGIDLEKSWLDLECDSLHKVEAIMRLEEIFNIQIDDNAFENCNNLSSVILYIDSLR